MRACVRAVSGHGDRNAAMEELMGAGHILDVRGQGREGSSFEVQHPELKVIAFIALENIQEQLVLGGKMTGNMDFTS